MTRVTDLDDARTNKALGIPVNTPVEQMGRVAEGTIELIASVLKAAMARRSALYAFYKIKPQHVCEAETYTQKARARDRQALGTGMD